MTMSRENSKRDFIREYLSFLQVEKGLAKNSVESYERDLVKLRVWAEKNGFEIVNLTRQDLREWLIDLAGAKLSDNSKRRLISALRGFYKFLQFDGHIKKNPAENLVAPQKGLYLPNFLNENDIEIEYTEGKNKKAVTKQLAIPFADIKQTTVQIKF